ncbi:unnamed protein product [Alopecurus aequalis]
MDVSQNRENNGEVVGVIMSCGLLLHSLLGGLGRCAAGFGRNVGEIAREDPRRVVHSLKVGLALALVSVVYFVTPLFNSLGDSTMWAVLTVVVVMEYTVGATLSKGLNRGFATLVAACIAVGAHKLAELAERFGVQGEPISLAVFVFFIASAATFLRFIPEIKAKYDYGVTIFILTFSLVAVSSYRVEELIQLAHQRFYTIIVGVFICLLTTVFVFPVWAGEGVHKLAFGNLDKLAQFFEVHLCKMGASSWQIQISTPMEPIPEARNSVSAVRIFHGDSCFICHHDHKNQASPDLSSKVRKTCGELSSQSAKVLRQLATATENMTVPPPANLTVSAAMKAAEGLRSELADNADLLQVMHVAVTASLLADLVGQVKEIAECVDVLARHAHFKNPRRAIAVDALSRGRSGPLPDVVIQCAE